MERQILAWLLGLVTLLGIPGAGSVSDDEGEFILRCSPEAIQEVAPRLQNQLAVPPLEWLMESSQDIFCPPSSRVWCQTSAANPPGTAAEGGLSSRPFIRSAGNDQ